jgi:hypothetical protein
MTRRILVAAAALSLAACQPIESEERLSLPPHSMQQLHVTIAVPGDHATIADALAVAQTGDVVHVEPGVYAEDLTVPGGVILQGSGIFDTIIDGQITVNYGEAGLVSLGIIGPGAAAASICGVTVNTGDSVEMVSVYVSNYYAAVCIDSGPNLTIDAPTVDRASLTNNGYGVLVMSGDATVTNSYFSYAIRSGIYTYDDASVNATNNTFLGNSFGGDTNDRDGAISLGANGTSNVQNNNVVSNHFGMQCEGCSATWTTNNVWGNTTNYAGDASNNGGDFSFDPIFRSVSTGNFRLSEVSPLIDIGTDAGAPGHDWDGLPRPSGAGTDIGADEWSISEYTVVINEVMANPTVESTGEFVEILNVGQLDQDLAGIILTDGDQEDIIEGYLGGTTVVPAGGIAVILDPGYAGQYSIPVDAILLTTGNATLGNGLSTNDPIQLREPNGYVAIDEWTIPYNPGDGNSIERVDATIGNVASNWVNSLCVANNSAGSANCAAGNVAPNDPSVLVLTEIMANPLDEQSGEYLEIVNMGTEAVDLSGLWVRDISATGNTSDDDLISFAGSDTVLLPGATALILDPGNENQYREPLTTVLMTTTDATIGNGLSASGDSVELWDGEPDNGGTLIDSFSWPWDAGDGVAIEKIDNAGGDFEMNWVPSNCSSGHSSGRLNCQAGGVGTSLVINEVLNNPLDEQSGEFVELYNFGGTDIELAGLSISDGDQTDVLVAYDGGPTLLGAGGFALIIDSGFEADFVIEPGTILVTTSDAHIGNGLAVTDPITLLEFDGTSPIDTWSVPFNPGNGTSVEKINHLTNDYTSNWDAADCAAGSSPGLANCVSYSPIAAGTTELWISEVMSNPLDEGTGEFIELYNYGTDIIDLWGYILYDGDAWDFLREFNSGSTLVYPGEYAVIVDLQFAGQYTIPSGTTVVTVDDGAIGSGLATNDPVYLYEWDGYSVIDGYSFPFNAGNGTSVERTVLSDGDIDGNWASSTCAAGHSLGLDNCP